MRTPQPRQAVRWLSQHTVPAWSPRPEDKGPLSHPWEKSWAKCGFTGCLSLIFCAVRTKSLPESDVILHFRQVQLSH